jgi:hypothetical protein
MQIETYTDRLKPLVQAAHNHALRNGQYFSPIHVLEADVSVECMLLALVAEPVAPAA